MADPPRKQRCLGRQLAAKQRASQANLSDSAGTDGIESLEDSKLVMSCLAKWSKGLLHATEVQEICFDAYQDQMNLLQKLHLSPEAVKAY